jgi:GT2 family glycosyltransferase
MEFQPDLWERLNKIEADIACGMFWQRRVPSHPTIAVKVKAKDGTDALQTIVPDEKVQDVDVCGMAATLIRKPVLDWAEYPAFRHLGWLSEDFEFCLQAGNKGFKIKCDTSLKVAHRGDIAFNGQPILSYKGMTDICFPFGMDGDGSKTEAV